MATYLVTGNAGFIGSAISNKLLAMGHQVYGIDNLNTGYRKNISDKVIFIEGDFSKDEVISQLNKIRFDAIFHIGGQSSGEISYEDPEYDLNTNTLSTLKLLQYCQSTGCKKFIYASTMSVYGEKEGQEQFGEKDEANPKSFYAVGKLASEKYMDIFSKQFGIDFVSLRYFNVYGPGQNLKNMKQGMVSIYLQQFMDNTFEKVEVKGDLNRFRDLIYIDDIVDITIESAYNEKFSNQIINIGTGQKTTVSEILRLVKKYTDSEKEITITSGTLGDQFGIYADNTKLLSLHRNKLVAFENGLKKMILWVKDNNDTKM
jgi:UDP-glucose 4-epimerase